MTELLQGNWQKVLPMQQLAGQNYKTKYLSLWELKILKKAQILPGNIKSISGYLQGVNQDQFLPNLHWLVSFLEPQQQVILDCLVEIHTPWEKAKRELNLVMFGNKRAVQLLLSEGGKYWEHTNLTVRTSVPSWCCVRRETGSKFIQTIPVKDIYNHMKY